MVTLYHGTTRRAARSILKHGLRPKNPGWCVYLSPQIEDARHFGRGYVFEVGMPDDAEFTAVDEETAEWELLYWGDIPAERVKLVEGAL